MGQKNVPSYTEKGETNWLVKTLADELLLRGWRDTQFSGVIITQTDGERYTRHER